MSSAEVETPVGSVHLCASNAGIRTIEFGEDSARAGARGQAHPLVRLAAAQLREYFAGERLTFELPLDLAGTSFQRRAWLALASIPFGETVSYGEQARRLGVPQAARAVGAANGRNPVAIVLPCHRVIGARGELVGYGGGLEVKRALLEHEARVLAARG